MDEIEFIYKYMTFEQFIDLIELKRLYLTQITAWEDTHEGYMIKEFYEKESGINKHLLEKFINPLVEKSRKASYAQSWTHSDIESDALWRIYSQQKTGVRIKVRIDDIKNQINEKLNSNKEMYGNLLKGPVEYGVDMDYEKYRIENDKVNFLFIKRMAFKHEEEYRFSTNIKKEEIFQRTSKYETITIDEVVEEFEKNIYEAKLPKTIYYKVPNDLIQEIILDPRAADYFEETFSTYCENRDLNKSGVKFKKSDLYKSF